MPSLGKKVAHQRDALMARGPGLRLYGERLHARLRRPVVVIPAFLAGMVTARGVPELLRALPRLTERLQYLTAELARLHSLVRLIVSLVTVGPCPSDATPGESGGAIAQTRPDRPVSPSSGCPCVIRCRMPAPSPLRSTGVPP